MDEGKEKVEDSKLESGDIAAPPQKSLKYPKSVFFIISNEFCERFCYYGMRTVLSIYLTDILLYSEDEAKIIYHTFTMFVYFFPVFGAMLADSLLGKFNTIFYVSMIYAFGEGVLTLGAIPKFYDANPALSLTGLFLIAVGTGGIKPCVSAFGGDQFILPQQEKQLATFFSLFYFSINFGSFISTLLTPLLRETECFDQTSCFSLAFGVPGILMVVSIIIFGVGKLFNLYLIKKPQGNIVIEVSKCIGNAVKMKFRARKSKDKKDHWLDYADESKYTRQLVGDTKAVLRVLFLYLPLPVFWALFDQQGTGWTFQARRMNGDVGNVTILPDQLQVVNPLLILLFIPLFEYVVYPVFHKCGLLKKPLQRMFVGGMLAAVAFTVSAFISLAIEAAEPQLPQSGEAQLLIYNNLNCDLTFDVPSLAEGPIVVGKLSHSTYWSYFQGTKDLPYTITDGNCYTGIDKTGTFYLYEAVSTGYYFQNTVDKPVTFEDNLAKDEHGHPLVRTLYNGVSSKFIEYFTDKDEKFLEVNSTDSSLLDLEKPRDYIIKIDNNKIATYKFRAGAVYAVMIIENGVNDYTTTLDVVTTPNEIHMLWLIPQYVIITAGEIMYSITGLEFSYSQSPISMKSLLQACWLLTSAFGNLLIVIIESAQSFDRQSMDFFLYAVIMAVDMVIFALMSMSYTYVEDLPKLGGSESDRSSVSSDDSDIKARKVSSSSKKSEKGLPASDNSGGNDNQARKISTSSDSSAKGSPVIDNSGDSNSQARKVSTSSKKSDKGASVNSSAETTPVTGHSEGIDNQAFVE